MRFSLTRPVKIVMLGAGGTGGHIAPNLYRLLFSLNRNVRFIICDGDLVEKKNLVRQNFTVADLGDNKAKALAERYASVFGLNTEYIPDFIESEERLSNLLTPKACQGSYHYEGQNHSQVLNRTEMKELVILIGAVDNNKSRKICNEVFQSAEELVYIDSGNGEHTGQIVCGIRRSGKTMYKPVGSVYPEVLEATDKFPTELSCAEASISAPQSIAANITAATMVVDIIYNILALGDNTVRQATFATRTVNIKPILQKRRGKPL